MGRKSAVVSLGRLALIAFAVLAILHSGALAQVSPAEQLKINVLRGEGDVHRRGEKAGSTIEIAVLNEVDLPQPQADCSFTTDQDGAGVRLEKDTSALSLKRGSDIEGKVLIEGVYGNSVNGPVTIKVSCTFEGKDGSVTINQVNERGPFWTRNRILLVLGAMGTAGISLYEAYKPGPPTATINAPTAGTASGQVSIRVPKIRVGR